MSLRSLTTALADSQRWTLDAIERAKANLAQMSPSGVMAAAGSGGPLGRLFGTSNSEALNRSQFSHNSGWVYACIRVIANRISGQPICAARKVRAGKRSQRAFIKSSIPKAFEPMSDEMELIRDHEIIETMRRPNPVMVQHTFMYCTVSMFILTGQAMWWISEDEDGRKVIWPVPAHWMTPNLDGAGNLVSWTMRPSNSLESIDIPAEDVAVIFSPDPSNPTAPYSAMQAAARPILADEQLQETQRRHFHAPHNLLAIHTGRLPDAKGDAGKGPRMHLEQSQRQRIEAMVMQMWAGVVNYGKPIILDDVIEKIEEISRKPNEMGYEVTGKMLKERITQIFGVNPIVMGQIENANRASAVEADRNFLAINVNPCIEHFSQWLTAFVAPRFTRSKEQLYVWITPGKVVDPDSERAEADLLMKYASLTIDELRARAGMPPLEGNIGGMVLLPSTATLVDPLTYDPEAAAEEEAEPAAEDDEYEDTEEDDAKRRLCWSKRLSRDEIANLWDRLHSKLESKMADDLQAVLVKLGSNVIARLRQSDHLSMADQLLDVGEWGDEIKAVAESHLLDAAIAGASLELQLSVPRDASASWRHKQFGISGSVLAAIQGFLSRLFSLDFWAGIGTAIRNALRNVILGGITDGKSVDQVANEIKDTLGPTGSAARATAIARTELNSAMNFGQSAQMKELAEQGIVLMKEWLGTIDGLIRPAHRAAHGQRRLVDEAYDIGGEAAQFPGDPSLSAANRCNCRCSQLSITSESPPQIEENHEP